MGWETGAEDARGAGAAAGRSTVHWCMASAPDASVARNGRSTGGADWWAAECASGGSGRGASGAAGRRLTCASSGRWPSTNSSRRQSYSLTALRPSAKAATCRVGVGLGWEVG